MADEAMTVGFTKNTENDDVSIQNGINAVFNAFPNVSEERKYEILSFLVSKPDGQ